MLGGGPAPESTGAWSQAGASVFIELSPSLHTEAWGLGAGGNAPLHLGPDSADQQGSAGGAEQLHEHGSARAGVSSAGLQPLRDCLTGGCTLERVRDRSFAGPAPPHPYPTRLLPLCRLGAVSSAAAAAPGGG